MRSCYPALPSLPNRKTNLLINRLTLRALTHTQRAPSHPGRLPAAVRGTEAVRGTVRAVQARRGMRPAVHTGALEAPAILRAGLTTERAPAETPSSEAREAAPPAIRIERDPRAIHSVLLAAAPPKPLIGLARGTAPLPPAIRSSEPDGKRRLAVEIDSRAPAVPTEEVLGQLMPAVADPAPPVTAVR